MKRVQEHKHSFNANLRTIFISLIVSILVVVVIHSNGIVSVIPSLESKIFSLEKNLTEMQDWFRENSKEINSDFYVDVCIKNIYQNPAYDCYQGDAWSYHVFKGTNISTERFFR